MKKRKVPLRMCIGCQEMKSKKELIRIVKNKENKISVDLLGKSPGRGAYICNNVECFDKMKKGKKLERAFETSIQEEVYEALRCQIGEKEESHE